MKNKTLGKLGVALFVFQVVVCCSLIAVITQSRNLYEAVMLLLFLIANIVQLIGMPERIRWCFSNDEGGGK